MKKSRLFLQTLLVAVCVFANGVCAAQQQQGETEAQVICFENQELDGTNMLF